MSTSRRHGVTLASALALAAIAPNVYAQTTRIAVVDLQRALLETEDGRRAKARLKRLLEKHQREIESQQKALEAQKKQIEQLVGIDPDAPVVRERAAEYQKAAVELQSQVAESQRELAEAEARLMRPILERMQRILRRIGQSEGYQMIFERSEAGVVWAPTNLDLTDQVIQRYNAGEGREGEAPAREDAGPRRRGRGATKRD